MDPLLVILIVVAVIAMSGWGYGYYTARPVVTTGDVVAGPAPWVSPAGVIGLLAIIALAAMLFSGWRPFAVAP